MNCIFLRGFYIPNRGVIPGALPSVKLLSMYGTSSGV
jgi:hypothetical protein